MALEPPLTADKLRSASTTFDEAGIHELAAVYHPDVKFKDPIQSNVTIDPAWWAYVTALTAFVAAWVTETTAAGLLAPLYPNTLAAGATVASTAAAATTITSLPADGSLNTCSDT